jgi:peptidyl-prolyl cis-trans isomerase C
MPVLDTIEVPQPPQSVAAPIRVNGFAITAAALAGEIQNHPAATASAAREAAAAALVVRQLLLQEAVRLDLVAAPATDEDGRRETDEDALVRQLLDREVAVPAATDEECRRFYAHNPQRFRSPDIFEAAHILFAAPRDDTDAYAAALEDARQTIAVLAEESGRFDALARSLSACPSAEVGGNLGQIIAGQTTPEFEAAVMMLTPGSITPEPVESRYGAHVIRLDRRHDGVVLPFDLVRRQIADYLADRVFRRAVHQYISILAGRARIEGVDITAATNPLVQ